MLANRTKPWSDPTGVQIANPQRFPSGMKHLADALHQKGLRFGVYSARCRYTCQKFAGSFGHEVADAAQWASWGVDYLKLDEVKAFISRRTFMSVSARMPQRELCAVLRRLGWQPHAWNPRTDRRLLSRP